MQPRALAQVLALNSPIKGPACLKGALTKILQGQLRIERRCARVGGVSDDQAAHYIHLPCALIF